MKKEIARVDGSYIGEKLERLAALLHTLKTDRSARRELKQKAKGYAVTFLAGVLCGVLWLRAVDVQGVEQRGGEAVRIAEDGAAAQCGGVPLISHGEAVTVSPQGEVKGSEEAEAVAKLLYGIRKNSERDLRAVCWVVFNRVESPLYPGTLEEVVNQPGQWVSYYPENPVTKELYAMALEELGKWERDEGRPISADTLWFNWSKDAITFREEF